MIMLSLPSVDGYEPTAHTSFAEAADTPLRIPSGNEYMLPGVGTWVHRKPSQCRVAMLCVTSGPEQGPPEQLPTAQISPVESAVTPLKSKLVGSSTLELGTTLPAS